MSTLHASKCTGFARSGFIVQNNSVALNMPLRHGKLSPMRKAVQHQMHTLRSSALLVHHRTSASFIRTSSCICNAAARAPSDPHIQLGTAALPDSADANVFLEKMYQWAATMTQSGANYPFALPLKVDKLDTGFKISLLKKAGKGSFESAAEIEGVVEAVETGKRVFFVRFFEGPAAFVDRRTPPPTAAAERLDAVITGLIDVQTIMQTMPNALVSAAKAAKP
eukprot:CAMPEP_0202900724 /NCGR_PEP_ID=MMETSP1392-20130828/12002_1 /ASSEMBLY_ACC=CAM_ASM_000868 /TAXON_ID=225041 /ORGANISM="Chlamydomonas chlamydogama, Strain SAG 11-48b" /LENGTH=222 /DNA_ID=CAMNT_0049587165 /DNA_START=102 /DNA_END=770 /DNA_ORIENTATION=+